MKVNDLFLDYLWDLMPNYFHLKDDDSDVSFNRPKLPINELDSIFLEHLNNKNIFIDKPVERNKLYIGLTKIGGKIWEDKFNINWMNYLYFEVNEVAGKQELSLFSQNRDLIFLIFPEYQNKLFANLRLLETSDIIYWKKLEKCYTSKIVFDQENDDDLWQRFHDADLPKWRDQF